MKIRVMGTKNECLVATAYYRELEKDPNVRRVEVSEPYQNRGSNTTFRVYIEVEYNDVVLETAWAGEPLPSPYRIKGRK